jgi:uncharacterized protein YjbI with pentapeptide repeats
LDRALRRREEAAERENLKLTLSMTRELRGVDLHGRDLHGVMLRHKDMRGANLRGANLSEASIERVPLADADLAGADLQGARFGRPGESVTDASLFGTDLTRADLRGAWLRCDLRAARFEGADLRGADLSESLATHPHPEKATDEEVIREAADFRGAKYDHKTRWPDGVDPEKVGAIRVDKG